MKGNKILKWISMVLSTVGALAWGIAGATGIFSSRYFIVDVILKNALISNILYVLVGVSAIYLIIYGRD